MWQASSVQSSRVSKAFPPAVPIDERMDRLKLIVNGANLMSNGKSEPVNNFSSAGAPRACRGRRGT